MGYQIKLRPAPLMKPISIMFKALLKTIIPRNIIRGIYSVKNNYFGGFALISYSQEGEDRILKRIFENQSIGFYVDVGAHHPLRFSNTYLFYKEGWSGINIDAMPGSMKPFRARRPRDINLEQAVANDEKELTYYCFNEPALNGFSKELSKERDSKKNSYSIIDELCLKTKKLSSILDEHVPSNVHIDFLSIDVEGLDFDVLKSNDWKRYSPRIVLIEVLSKSISDIQRSEMHVFLDNLGYHLHSKCVRTVIYKKD